MKLLSRKDPRIVDLQIAYGIEGFGVYCLLVDYFSGKKAMRSPSDSKRIAYLLNLDAELVRAVMCDFGLFDFILESQPECASESIGNSEATATQPQVSPTDNRCKPHDDAQQRHAVSEATHIRGSSPLDNACRREAEEWLSNPDGYRLSRCCRDGNATAVREPSDRSEHTFLKKNRH